MFNEIKKVETHLSINILKHNCWYYIVEKKILRRRYCKIQILTSMSLQIKNKNNLI